MHRAENPQSSVEGLEASEALSLFEVGESSPLASSSRRCCGRRAEKS
eukprot:COSAG02_NODE_29630_length_565_cov_41.489270_1_plen_46_part_10